MDCHYCSVLEKPDSLVIYDSGCWVLLLCKYQFTLGVCQLVLKIHKEGMISISARELAEAHKAFMIVEQALKSAFQADWFNYFLTNNKERHLHFHIIPRYQSDRQFEGETFTDPNFSGMPKFSGNVYSDIFMEKIAQKIKENLPQKKTRKTKLPKASEKELLSSA